MTFLKFKTLLVKLKWNYNTSNVIKYIRFLIFSKITFPSKRIFRKIVRRLGIKITEDHFDFLCIMEERVHESKLWVVKRKEKKVKKKFKNIVQLTGEFTNEVVNYCEENFGKRYTSRIQDELGFLIGFKYHADGVWEYTRGSFYFAKLEDAVTFKLRFEN